MEYLVTIVITEVHVTIVLGLQSGFTGMIGSLSIDGLELFMELQPAIHGIITGFEYCVILRYTLFHKTHN